MRRQKLLGAAALGAARSHYLLFGLRVTCQRTAGQVEAFACLVIGVAAGRPSLPASRIRMCIRRKARTAA